MSVRIQGFTLLTLSCVPAKPKEGMLSMNPDFTSYSSEKLSTVVKKVKMKLSNYPNSILHMSLLKELTVRNKLLNVSPHAELYAAILAFSLST